MEDTTTELSESIFRVGDKVFDILMGWGIVEEVNSPDVEALRSVSPVLVRFCYDKDINEDSRIRYTLDGSAIVGKKSIKILSFTEYIFTGMTQKRPEELPEKGTPVFVRNKGSWELRRFSHKNFGGSYVCFKSQEDLKDQTTGIWDEMSVENPLK